MRTPSVLPSRLLNPLLTPAVIGSSSLRLPSAVAPTASPTETSDFARRGQGFESPRLHSKNMVICRQNVETERTLDIPSGQPAVLAVGNLLRGSRVGLPTGQDVAEAMGFTPLRPNQIADGDECDVLLKRDFHRRTPLWYYILREAELQGGANDLGRSAAGYSPRCSSD
jgi:hypothetical protein